MLPSDLGLMPPLQRDFCLSPYLSFSWFSLSEQPFYFLHLSQSFINLYCMWILLSCLLSPLECQWAQVRTRTLSSTLTLVFLMINRVPWHTGALSKYFFNNELVNKRMVSGTNIKLATENIWETLLIVQKTVSFVHSVTMCQEWAKTGISIGIQWTFIM